MACSRFEYVKKFEDDDRLLPGCWFLVRLDGRGFTHFCKRHSFAKPNDERALQLMNCAARSVMSAFRDVIISYGQSDEYSFVFRRETALFNRRKSKILSCVVSLFSSAYVLNWNRYIENSPLIAPPSFDGRIVMYPTTAHLRDYLSWRQADVHVNNLYNTVFWNLVGAEITPVDAERRLKGTLASDKNEILFAEFGINYNNEKEIFRKGSTIIRNEAGKDTSEDGLEVLHCDIIREQFWAEHPHLLHPPDSAPPRIK